VTVRKQPCRVTEELEAEEEVIAACPEETANEFDYNLTKRRAIYKPYDGCLPSLPAIDWELCTKCGRCQEAAGGKGIVLDAEPTEFQVDAGVIVVATGFDHYEPHPGEYGYAQPPEALQGGPKTVPELAEITGFPSHEVFWHIVSMRKYGQVTEGDQDGDYLRYMLIERDEK